LCGAALSRSGSGVADMLAEPALSRRGQAPSLRLRGKLTHQWLLHGTHSYRIHADVCKFL
jgi:hypothetical protein